jgi:hypothetical protein
MERLEVKKNPSGNWSVNGYINDLWVAECCCRCLKSATQMVKDDIKKFKKVHNL